MEGIEAEIEEKKIEREVAQPLPPVQDKVVEKPKRARSQKQIEAFEKARAKRAENLKKKREEEEAMMAQLPDEEPQNKIEKPKPKRGRPRKSKMKREEPPAQQFVQPPQLPQHYQLPYPVQGQHYYPPPPHYHQGFQAPMPQPVNNYYYYGAPPEQEPKVEKKVQFEPEPQPEPQPLPPDPQLYQPEEESEDEEVELPPDPRMKYRFA